jgi:hypothetical protein
MGESFFATLECELLARRRCHSPTEANGGFRHIEAGTTRPAAIPISAIYSTSTFFSRCVIRFLFGAENKAGGRETHNPSPHYTPTKY